ncbi:hypothetical protein [Glycomyces artemisiae]|uniref:Galactose mutarotase-like enzyme n=1 Tax=Glycomyces artemisiae TaxID=1076443 RepID=A0A2T0UHC9_9ACTN|nr:hypothetical protein [Glycomyces artemisiae]PRY57351.1 galactose mutarotase-like enzyme [Glycomyces artemisiae]
MKRLAAGEYTVDVDPVGARIASIRHAPTGTEFLLTTPWNAEDWSGTYQSSGSNEEWHRRYPGGWHTLVPHAGDARTLDGVSHPFHGEAAWRRWRPAGTEADSSCTYEAVLRTAPLAVRRRVRATGTGVAVTQTVTNYSGRETAFTWVEHPAFGPALTGPEAEVTIGGDAVDVRFPAAGEGRSGFQELRTKGRGTAAIRNGRNAVALTWDPDLFPFLYVWQEHRGTAGYPWWGAADTIALEPAARPYDHGGGPLGPLRLAAGASLAAEFELTCTVEERP